MIPTKFRSALANTIFGPGRKAGAMTSEQGVDLQYGVVVEYMSLL